MRERAGLATRDAGQLLSVNAARISSIESGHFGVSAERARMFAHNSSPFPRCPRRSSTASLIGSSGRRSSTVTPRRPSR
ncbi:hypothetical protein [Streptomyces albofaciens]|uniref:hypothetical protein n=1 Tax=Streptomyces albofaciens TaxID=66866 RepID=UPI003137987C